jgi:hypothetical protein
MKEMYIHPMPAAPPALHWSQQKFCWSQEKFCWSRCLVVTNGKKILLVATKILLVAMKGVAVDGSVAAMVNTITRQWTDSKN